MSNLFMGTDYAKSYKQFRPQCPMQVLDIIIEYCKTYQSQFQLALDLGCGSGQNTLPLAPYFASVIGVDVSEAQIREAAADKAKPDNVQYRVNPAEDLTFLQDSSVDLITVATAFHWMDTEQVYKEARRILKPGGVIALYALQTIASKQKSSNDIIQKVVATTNTFCSLVFAKLQCSAMHTVLFSVLSDAG